MGRNWIAAIIVLSLSLNGTAQAIGLVDWKASQGPAMGTFSDVAIVAGTRVFSGYELDPFIPFISATVFTATGDPGSAPIGVTDLGLTFFSSAGTSLAEDGSGGYHLTVVQVQAEAELRSFIYPSADLGNPVQIFGALPESDPDVNLNGINRDGLAAGDLGGVLPLVATPSGFANYLDILVPARLTSVRSDGTRFGAFSELTPGGIVAATIISNAGAILLQESVAGSVEDLEGAYAVGTRDGLAAYWRDVGGTYVVDYVRDGSGTPLPGGLLAIDHQGMAIAGGYLDDGRAIVVDLLDGSWFDVALQLSLPPGSLLEIVGIDISNDQLALAANSADLVGYDITATIESRYLPGPGLLTAPALLIIGVVGARKRRASTIRPS